MNIKKTMSTKPTIHIIYNFKNKPWGGGNQFLKALKKELRLQGRYAEQPERADVILFNSHHSLEECYRIKLEFPSRIVILRIDGPVSLIRGRDRGIDKIVSLFNSLFADGIVFQSNWCMNKNKELFNISSKYETVIHNAPDREIFSGGNVQHLQAGQKIRLVAISWSPNWRKGFDIYKYLDEALDFSRYEMTFVGNSPVEFKNIRWIKPVPTEELAEIISRHDIYITASRNDPCSNSLIEAASYGLPVVAINDGGHPELVEEGGELFCGETDILEKIQKVSDNYAHYQKKVPRFSIKAVARDYYNFGKKIFEDNLEGVYIPKHVGLLSKINYCKMRLMKLQWKIFNKASTVKAKLWGA